MIAQAHRVSRVDVAIACALWLLGFAVGGSYMRTFAQHGGVGDFGQQEFGAAVALACGRGFVNFGYTSPPSYASFLQRESDAFSCDDLPNGPAPYDLNFTQRLYRYLMSTVAAVWAIRGVSWSGLWPLFGAMFGTVVACAYGLFRSGVGRALSVAAALALTVSAIHLGYLPYLRDYAKAPFMLALLLVMVRMAAGPFNAYRLIALAIAFGVILGIGFGFRNDLMIHVPPFVGVVFLGTPGSIRSNLRVKSLALAAAALSFVIVAWPIVRAYRGGSNTGHVAALGLTTPFDRTLGIRGAMYDWGYAYVDQYVADVIIDYAHRTQGRFVEYLSSDYEQAAISYLARIARLWPADMLTRVYASIVNIVQMPFTVGVWASSIPFGLDEGSVLRVYGWQTWLLSRYLTGSGLIVTGVALTCVAVRSIPTATALLALLVYYTGYPAIQFGARHFFHLEFIGWWALAFVVQQAAGVLRHTMTAGAVDRAAAVRALARGAAFAATATVMVVGSVATLRAYQTPRVRSSLRDYVVAPRAPLPHEAVRGADGKALIVSERLWDAAPGESLDMPVRSRYIAAEFSASAGCDALRLPVTFKYWFEDRTSNFSRPMVLTLAPGGAPTVVLFPAYADRQWSSFAGPSRARFDGIELPAAHVGCLASLSQVADLHQHPLLIDATLSPAWEQSPAYQTIAAFERTPDREVAYYAAPENLVVTRAMFDSAQQGTLVDAVSARATIETRTTEGWVARGRLDGPESRLLDFAVRSVAAGATVLARGALRDGGVAFHLTVDGRPIASVTVTRPGPFAVAMEAPAGQVGVELTNAITPWWPASQIGHRIGPLVAWIPGATLRADVTLEQIGWSLPHENVLGER